MRPVSVFRRMWLAATFLLMVSITPKAPAQTVDLGLGRVDQIALTVSDIEVAEDFYENTLGLRKTLALDNLLLFDLAGVRLLLGFPEDPERVEFPVVPLSTVYLRCPDLAVCMSELQRRGITFEAEPEFVSRQSTFDLWIAFFRDPDENSLALMAEVPRGVNPLTGERE